MSDKPDDFAGRSRDRNEIGPAEDVQLVWESYSPQGVEYVLRRHGPKVFVMKFGDSWGYAVFDDNGLMIQGKRCFSWDWSVAKAEALKAAVKEITGKREADDDRTIRARDALARDRG